MLKQYYIAIGVIALATVATVATNQGAVNTIKTFIVPEQTPIINTQIIQNPNNDTQNTEIITENNPETKTEAAFYTAEMASLDETQCNQRGYDWVQLPGLCPTGSCGSRCDIKMADAGKDCYSNIDCQGACLCNGTKDSEGFQIGKCSQHKYFTEVNDCPCVLETKSTKVNYLYCQ